MVFLHKDKAYLHTLLVQIKNYLDENLKLKLKGNYQIFPIESRGIDFVGYVFYHDHILLRKSIKQSFWRMVIKLRKSSPQKIQRKTSSYYGWAKHCNAKHLLKNGSTDVQQF